MIKFVKETKKPTVSITVGFYLLLKFFKARLPLSLPRYGKRCRARQKSWQAYTLKEDFLSAPSNKRQYNSKVRPRRKRGLFRTGFLLKALSFSAPRKKRKYRRRNAFFKARFIEQHHKKSDVNALLARKIRKPAFHIFGTLRNI